MTRIRAAGSAAKGPILRVLPGGADAEPPIDLDAVARCYAPYIAAVALRILGNDDEVDDVVQDALVEAHRGLGRLRDQGALKGWLARIAVRCARRRLRRRALRRWFGLGSDPDVELLAESGANPEHAAEVRSAYRLLERMPADERIVWVLRQVEGENLEQIADLCSCSLSTVQRRLRAARAYLEKAIRP
jgi:RNA polymerase sigma-70 factor, ECF subfamily